MPWVTALLRGQRVWARATDSGELASDGGRVEVRYKPNDGRAYRAASGNLVVAKDTKLLPDDACGPAEAAPEKSVKKLAAKSAKAVAATVASRAHTSGERETGGERDRDTWIAYTDGACSGNPGPAGAGFVVIAPDAKIHEGYENLGIGTNNVAELTGILRAVEAIPDAAPRIVVHTDSKYAIGVLTQGWKPKANQALIATIRAALAKRGKTVTLVYVPGHAGVPMNERADELAREAIRARGSKLLPKLTGPAAPVIRGEA